MHTHINLNIYMLNKSPLKNLKLGLDVAELGNTSIRPINEIAVQCKLRE
jgi:hypothetical protein